MMLARRRKQAVTTAFWLVVFAALWLIFAPQQLGGQVGYVIVDGNSMEPTYSRGDLVLVRRAPFYQVGEAVAYYHAVMDRYVIHRIIALEIDRFILRGDHNTWVDSYNPAPAEVMGKQWLHLPGVGKIIIWLRRPLHTAIFAGFAGGFLVLTMAQSDPPPWRLALQQKKHRWKKGSFMPKLLGSSASPASPPAAPVPDSAARQARALSQSLEIGLFVFGILLFGALALGYFAFSRPIWLQVPENLKYWQRGHYRYAAAAPAGVYNADRVEPGDPLYLRLVCGLDLTFDYQLDAPKLENVRGEIQISASLSDTNGWQRTLLYRPPLPFTGRQASTSLALDLCQLAEQVKDIESQTGVTRNDYTLIVQPVVTAGGLLNGEDLQTRFEPPLIFRFSDLQLYLATEGSDPLNPEKEDGLLFFAFEQNTLPWITGPITIWNARQLAVGSGVFALLGLALIGGLTYRTSQRSHAAAMQLKYAPLLVDLQGRSLELPGRIVDVSDMDALARTAERSGSMILHEQRSGMHFYFALDGGVAYRYAIQDIVGSQAALTLPQLEADLRRGMENGELQLAYQPVFELADNRLVSVEGLLRWQHPQRGLLSPADFLPAAEHSGLMLLLNEWVMHSACHQLYLWQQSGWPELQLSLNLSVSSLDEQLVAMVRRVLDKTAVSAEYIQLELPEAGLLTDVEKSMPTLLALRQMGLRIALDDFSGQVSFSALGKLAVDGVKLARSFSSDLAVSAAGDASHWAIAALNGIGYEVGVKGIETQQQLDGLRLQPVSSAQGFLLGRPLSAEELTDLLRTERQ